MDAGRSVWGHPVRDRLRSTVIIPLFRHVPPGSRGIVAAVSSIFAARLVKFGYEKGERLVPLTFAVIIDTVAVYVLQLTEIEREDLVSFPSMSPKVG